MPDPQLADVSSLIRERDDAITALREAETHWRDDRQKSSDGYEETIKVITAQRDEARAALATFRSTLRGAVHNACLSWFGQAIAPQWGRITTITKDEKGVAKEVASEGWLVQMTPSWLADRLGTLELGLAKVLGA